jgi:uncharacterized protein YsxB (DUF464 family)
MIKVTIYKDSNDDFKGFQFIGHAEYGDVGEDVVCAGVSALVITTINSIEILTKDKFVADSNEKTGMMKLTFKGKISHDSDLLVKALIIGIEGISGEYGNDYVRLLFEEV